jgi:hypothetical protein
MKNAMGVARSMWYLATGGAVALELGCERLELAEHRLVRHAQRQRRK